jgi:hypothetical protein
VLGGLGTARLVELEGYAGAVDAEVGHFVEGEVGPIRPDAVDDERERADSRRRPADRRERQPLVGYRVHLTAACRRLKPGLSSPRLCL